MISPVSQQCNLRFYKWAKMEHKIPDKINFAVQNFLRTAIDCMVSSSFTLVCFLWQYDTIFVERGMFESKDSGLDRHTTVVWQRLCWPLKNLILLSCNITTGKGTNVQSMFSLCGALWWIWAHVIWRSTTQHVTSRQNLSNHCFFPYSLCFPWWPGRLQVENNNISKLA
jgi:hypothetical protein